MRVVGRGHPALRATHDKTLELTYDTTITERATCVIATGCALPTEPMAGPIRITIATGGLTFALDASAVSSWRPGESLVVRRSGVRTPNTFAVDATATAADLPRELAAALADPTTEVAVDIERRPSSPTLVIASTHLPSQRMAAEITAADAVLDASDRHARAAPELAWDQLATPELDGRVLVRTDALLPRTHNLPAGMRVETVGLHPAAAAVAAAPWPGPVVFGTADEVDRAPADHLVVIRTSDPAGLLARAAKVRATTHVTIAMNGADPFLHDLADPLPRLPDVVWCCFALANESSALDPSVRSAVERLLDDGVPTKTAAKALAALTQQSQRAAYDVVLGLRAEQRT